MNQVFRYILIVFGVALGAFLVWRFSHIVTYVIISAVLSLIGRPLVNALGKIKIKGKGLPNSIRALITLISIWTIFILFISFIIPLVAAELEQLSTIEPKAFLSTIREPLGHMEEFISRYIVDNDERIGFEELISSKLAVLFSVDYATSFLANIASILGNVFLAIFSITFITFFFLKDEYLFSDLILSFVPDKHVDAFKHAMVSTRHLLIRYFIGISFQTLGIFLINTIGLTIIGVGFSHSILIGLVAGTLNIIPYLGPLLGGGIGILIGIATHLQLDFYTELLPLTGLMLIVIIIAQLTDNFIFQPFIFSSSVYAHPLEIFIVILVAASIGGIIGMIVAIPLYTIVRVFAKEFFNKFKVVKKLTKKIE